VRKQHLERFAECPLNAIRGDLALGRFFSVFVLKRFLMISAVFLTIFLILLELLSQVPRQSSTFIYSGEIVVMIPTFFLFTIFLIIALCSNKQVIWTHACRIITRMTNLQPFWNWSEAHFPRKSVCLNHSFSIRKADTSISSPFSFSESSNPKPASFCFLHKRPESLSKWFPDSWKCVKAFYAAKFSFRMDTRSKYEIAV